MKKFKTHMKHLIIKFKTLISCSIIQRITLQLLPYEKVQNPYETRRPPTQGYHPFPIHAVVSLLSSSSIITRDGWIK
jgi:hypothetical protein